MIEQNFIQSPEKLSILWESNYVHSNLYNHAAIINLTLKP